MSKLTKMIEYMEASIYKKSKMLNSPSFVKEIGKERHRELVSTEASESGQSLVQREILDSIFDGADYNKVLRDAVPVLHSEDGDSGRIVTHEHVDAFADIVPEVGKIPVHDGDYGHKNVSYKKIATRIKISEELIEDGRWDEIELELRLAGSRIENALNRYGLGIMLDDCDGDNQDGMTLNKLVDGVETIKTAKFIPSAFITHERAQAQLYDNANIISGIDLTRSGEGSYQLFGLEHYTLGMDTLSSATSSWDTTDSPNHYYGLLYDKLRYARIVIREDINISDIKDYKHDIRDVIAKMRVGVVVTHPNAGVRFLTA